MRRSLLLQTHSIVVATSFDEHAPGLISSAAAFCRRTERQLCLIHALEPFMQRPYLQPFDADDPLWNTARAVEINARQLALGRLRELAETFAAGLDVRALVVAGRRLDVLCHEAQRAGAGLLMVGASGRGGHGPLQLGISTALALLSTSSVPVLAMDGRSARTFPPERPRLLIADDLSDESAAAANYALELAALLGSSTLRHTHVNGVTLDALSAALTTAVAASHTPMNPPPSASEIHRSLVSRLTQAIATRAQGYAPDLANADCIYMPEVRTGPVLGELAASVTAFDPDLLLFGRHRAFHREGLFLGRLPFKAMLALGRPVLIVPND